MLFPKGASGTVCPIQRKQPGKGEKPLEGRPEMKSHPLFRLGHMTFPLWACEMRRFHDRESVERPHPWSPHRVSPVTHPFHWQPPDDSVLLGSLLLPRPTGCRKPTSQRQNSTWDRLPLGSLIVLPISPAKTDTPPISTSRVRNV